MKKFIAGVIFGAILATTASVYADEGLKKVEAYLRPSLPITLDGKPVKLGSSPVMYDGNTYLKLRDVAGLTGLEVNWNDSTQTVELGGGTASLENISDTPTETTHHGLRAIALNGEKYFAIFDYNNKFAPFQWGYDAPSNIVFLAETEKGTTTIIRKITEISKDDAVAYTIYKGESFVNVKYYQELEN